MTAGGKEPNLTPFIDLFSVLTCFLLVAFAWTRLDAMNVAADDSSAVAAAGPRLTLHLLPEKVIAAADGEEREIPNGPGGALDAEGLGEVLAAWREKHPDRRDVVLAPDGQAPYGAMIRLIDLLNAADFAVGVNPH